MKMITKVIFALINITVILFSFFLLTNHGKACEFDFIDGVAGECTTIVWGKTVVGVRCTAIYGVKPNLIDTPLIVSSLGKVLDVRCLPFEACHLGPAATRFQPSPVWKIGYLGKWECTHSFYTGGIPIDMKAAAIYTGPNCEERIKGKWDYFYTPYVEIIASCNGPESKSVWCLDCIKCLEPSCHMEDCTLNYGGLCIENCGSSPECHGVVPKSLGARYEFPGHYKPYLCNENCQPENVNLEEMFDVTYIINGMPIKADKNGVTYTCGDEILDVKVKVEINEKYKSEFVPHGEKVTTNLNGTMVDFGEEITLPKIVCRPHTEVREPSLYTLGNFIWCTREVVIAPYIVKEMRYKTISSYEPLMAKFPLPGLTINYNFPGVNICSRYTSGGKNFVILKNGSSLYDPNDEIWNKCCRDGIIDISLIEVNQVDETNEKGITEKSGFNFTFKVKDNRDPVCQDLFGKWELNIYRIESCSINPLKLGENPFECEDRLEPLIYVKRE
jgi:hypothetical protein